MELNFEDRFLWVQCQLDELGKLKSKKSIRKSLGSLPEGLHETYENILVKISNGNIGIVRQILQWLVCNGSTLSLAELHESLGIEPELDHINDEALLSSPEDIVELCGSLITITTEENVILAHLSVKDYLLSNAIRGSRASAFALLKTEVYTENAIRCLTYLSFADLSSGPATSAHDFEARLHQYPFLDHASNWWATYVQNANDSSELKETVLKFLSEPYHDNFLTSMQVIYSKDGWNSYPTYIKPLYYAASFGLEHIVRALLSLGAEVDAPGGRLDATAFHAAALQGNVRIMDILLQEGADPTQVDDMQATPLHSAALFGNFDAVAYLLDQGADLESKDAKMRTPYDYACVFGHSQAFHQLDTTKSNPKENKRSRPSSIWPCVCYGNDRFDYYTS